ncbi:MAG TPA: patatin-like phospholipase family protein [Mycobacteriales bacterium]|nr:patatin-like phospholipase family protein [Mycobacteriales bacterium]HWA66992.1 patatin-like phospholipase family protein [Mycobacteriales bacterium]
MTRALVLGGGGVAGIGWELGILQGLADAGVDLSNADRLVGTSAGSAVAAQLTSGYPLNHLYERQLSADLLTSELTTAFDPEELMRELGAAFGQNQPGPELFRAVGSYAMRARTVPESVRRPVIERRLPSHDWPDRDLRIAAIDAMTGRPRVFTSRDEVELVDAVTASCAVPGVWPPVTIQGSKYIDGGIRSGINLDLADGCDPVVVIAPMPEMPFIAPDVVAAAEAVRANARVVTITASQTSLGAIGSNPLDPATAKPAAMAGRLQAAAHVDEVREVWTA